MISEIRNCSEEQRIWTFWDLLLERYVDGMGGMFFRRPIGEFAFCVLLIGLFLISFQLSPGDELFDLEVPTALYFIAMGVLGAISGLVGSERRGLGAIAGMLCATMALVLLVLVMSWLSQIPLPRLRAFCRAIVVLIGFSPAVIFYATMERTLHEESSTDSLSKQDA